MDDLIDWLDQGAPVSAFVSGALTALAQQAAPTPVSPGASLPLDKASQVFCLWVMDTNGHMHYEHAAFFTESLDNLMLAVAVRYGSVSNIAVAFAAITPVSPNVYEGSWQKVNMALWRLSGNSNGMSVGGAQP